MRMTPKNSKLAARRSPLAAGFTVLFAMLIAALLLGVGLAIFDIIFKEVSFATVVRDSSYAIYAADTGNECALFWDLKCDQGGACSGGRTGGFASSSASVVPASGLMCNKQDISTKNISIVNAFLAGSGPNGTTPPPLNRSGSAATTTFAIYMNADNNGNPLAPPYCAIVQVVKFLDSSSVPHTYIISRGYNTCDITNPNRIERAYFISY